MKRLDDGMHENGKPAIGPDCERVSACSVGVRRGHENLFETSPPSTVQNFSVATTQKKQSEIRNRPLLLCTIRVGWQSRPLQKKKGSFVEVAVALISGHTFPSHRMHVQMMKNEHVVKKCHQHVNTHTHEHMNTRTHNHSPSHHASLSPFPSHTNTLTHAKHHKHSLSLLNDNDQ